MSKDFLLLKHIRLISSEELSQQTHDTLGMITWRSVGVSLSGEVKNTRKVFLSGSLDPNMNNVTGARCMWLPLVSSVL